MLDLSQKRLKEVLDYDPETGIFTRKNGRVAGSRDPRGYIRILIDGVRYWAHRLAFLYMTGEFPKSFVDHLSQDKGDNRWANLREATRSQNGFNRGRQRNNTSGFKGVSNWRDGRFQAGIKVDGRRIYLGIHETANAAAAAYDNAAKRIHGEFAALNFNARHAPDEQQGKLGI